MIIFEFLSTTMKFDSFPNRKIAISTIYFRVKNKDNSWEEVPIDMASYLAGYISFMAHALAWSFWQNQRRVCVAARYFWRFTAACKQSGRQTEISFLFVQNLGQNEQHIDKAKVSGTNLLINESTYLSIVNRWQNSTPHPLRTNHPLN